MKRATRQLGESNLMKRLGVVGLAAAAALISGSAAMAQTTLRIGLAEDPDVLDPTLARTYVGRIVFASLCDKLFDIDDKLNIVPQLALSHETSEDGKEVTIKLRQGVKFHDGSDFDSADVLATFNMGLNPGSPNHHGRSNLWEYYDFLWGLMDKPAQ